MSIRVVFLTALLAVAGCSVTGEYSINGSMTRDSDDCRAEALAHNPAGNDADSEKRQAGFERAYHACMQAKGYQA
jgi:hypothetical protein